MKLFQFFKPDRGGLLERKGTARKRQSDAQQTRKHVISRSIGPLVIALGLWAACSFCFLYDPLSGSVGYVEGQKANETIYAEVDFQYVDNEETDARKRDARARVRDIYRIENSANVETKKSIRELVSWLAEVRSGTSDPNQNSRLRQEQVDALNIIMDDESKRERLEANLNVLIREPIVAADAKQEFFDKYQKYQFVHEIAIDIEGSVPKLVNLNSLQTPQSIARQTITNSAEAFPHLLTEVQEEAAISAISQLITPNLMALEPETEAARRATVARVPEVINLVGKGSVFIKKDQLIRPSDLAQLYAHEIAKENSRGDTEYLLSTIWALAITLLIILFGGMLIYRMRPGILNKDMILIALVVAITMFVVRGTEIVSWSIHDGRTLLVLPGLPVALSAVLLSILLNEKVGIVVGIFQGMLLAIQSSEPLQILLLAMAAGSLGAVTVHHARTRIRTFRAGLMVAFAIFVIATFFMLKQSAPMVNYLWILGIALVNGFATVLLANLLLPVCESLFGITSDITLFELGDLNHTLLKRLQLEAPGTYHHSLMVATLSEHAAESIGANSLLCRVASYFHDIGKLSNPLYYTENTAGSSDRHADLTPRMSALVIINHVKEGLEMSARHKLCKPLRDAIASHHGTSLVVAFYNRAKQEETKNKPVQVEDFRYPGPLPRTKEAAIIALADSCEAASRSLEKPTPQKIDSLISEIFNNRIVDGQLKKAELTMGEINEIELSIKKNLTTMLHGRVAYPKLKENESNFIEASQKASAEGSATDVASDTARDQPKQSGPKIESK